MDHNCTRAHATREVQALTCELCGATVRVEPGQSADEELARHVAGCSEQMRPKTRRCPVKGCREKLTAVNTHNCRQCTVDVCVKHRFPEDHACGSEPFRGAPPGQAAGGNGGGLLRGNVASASLGIQGGAFGDGRDRGGRWFRRDAGQELRVLDHVTARAPAGPTTTVPPPRASPAGSTPSTPPKPSAREQVRLMWAKRFEDMLTPVARHLPGGKAFGTPVGSPPKDASGSEGDSLGSLTGVDLSDLACSSTGPTRAQIRAHVRARRPGPAGNASTAGGMRDEGCPRCGMTFADAADLVWHTERCSSRGVHAR